MSFVLPKDGNQVPFIGNLDNNNFVAVPMEQYVKIGGLYTPVSESNPSPSHLVGGTAHFSEETTASTTDAPFTANVTRWFTFANDDPTNNIQINFDATVGSAGTMTVHPGDVINGMPRKFTTLHVKASAGTPAFRAWGV